jgi:hypothetical protein
MSLLYPSSSGGVLVVVVEVSGLLGSVVVSTHTSAARYLLSLVKKSVK